MITKKIKLLLICIGQIGSFLFIPCYCLAQQTKELGVGIGGTSYKGEISPNYRFLNNIPALTVFYKKDISAPIVLRAGLTLGMMRAKDENFQKPLNQYRRAEMI